jgi:hypothetical protein
MYFISRDGDDGDDSESLERVFLFLSLPSAVLRLQPRRGVIFGGIFLTLRFLSPRLSSRFVKKKE